MKGNRLTAGGRGRILDGMTPTRCGRLWPFLSGMVLSWGLLVPAAFGQTYPHILDDALLGEAPYRSAGVVATNYGEGSGAVARDSRLIYSCAHVVFDKGKWSPTFRFVRACHSENRPRSTAYVAARGFRYFSSYSGGDGNSSFALDCIIAYGTVNSNFGPALPVLADAASDLTSSASKMILGYPGEIDYTGEAGSYHQRRTGPFTLAFSRRLKAYFEISKVSTGPGNSGGPVLVSKGGTHYLAGILVSGAKNMAGIYALNPAVETMGTEALKAAGVDTESESVLPTQQIEVINDKSVWLPDGRKRPVRRALPVRRQGKTATSVTLDLEVEAEYQGDLDIWLRSPRGRIYWLAENDVNNDDGDLVLSGEDLGTVFAGYNPNGVWTLFLRDCFREDRARFVRAGLTVESQ